MDAQVASRLPVEILGTLEVTPLCAVGQFLSECATSGVNFLKRILIQAAKFGISAAIIGWLVVSAKRNDPQVFNRMLHQPKDWWMLSAAWVCCMGGVMLTIVRWYLLVRAVKLPFTMKDSLRLGFLGYFLNFVSLGSVGGDLFKAIFAAREAPGRRAEAVASVVIDRVVGLYALLVLSTIAILATDLVNAEMEEIRLLCWATFACTAAGAAGIGVMLIPGITSGRLSQIVTDLPKIGATLGSVIDAIRMYRSRFDQIIVAGLISLLVHSCMAFGIYFIARALPSAAPGIAAHFVAVPLSMLTGALPLPVSGLGAFEAAVEFLYLKLPIVEVAVPQGAGLLVALTYRMITITIAMVGAGYYLAARREMARVIHDAEVGVTA